MKTAICAIAKNENDYINDWCEWHINLGFDKIFIFDNNEPETPFVGNFLKNKTKEHVIIIPVNHFKQFQKQAYNDFYKNFGVNYDWSAFIDIDEFIVLNKNKNIKDFLSNIKDEFNSVRLNWQIYGDDHGKASDDVSIPIFKRITEKLNHIYNNHGKCIIRGNLKNIDFKSVHYPLSNNKMLSQCLPSGKKLDDHSKIDLKEQEFEIAYLAHYMTKTYNEFKKQKLNRTDAALTRILNDEYFYRINKK